MAQYIDKDAVIAEIEKKIKQYEMAFDNPSFASYEASLIAKGKYRKLLDILQFLDTLEVKDLELGIKKSVNESIIRKIVDLNNEAAKHYDAVIKKEREENGFSQLAIDLFDHKVDANELRIQYIIENLKAQKGE